MYPTPESKEITMPENTEDNTERETIELVPAAVAKHAAAVRDEKATEQLPDFSTTVPGGRYFDMASGHYVNAWGERLPD